MSDNRGVASSDGSTSAAFLVSTYYGVGTNATFSDNTLTDNSTGIFVGYDASDASDVTIGTGNTVTGGDTGLVVIGNGTVATPDNLGGPNGTIDWFGGADANVIAGASLADELSGGGGADTISAGAGDDTIFYAVGDGSDVIDGGEGGETLGDTLEIDLDDAVAASTTTLTGTVNGSSELELDFGNGDVATVVDVENLVIDADADGSSVTMSGDLASTGISSSTVTFNGGAGADTFDGSGVTSATSLDLAGNGGADTLSGGAGADTIDGGADDDSLAGNGGADTLSGGTGTDTGGFSGDFADYTVSFNAGTGEITVADDQPGVDGDDGTDVLTSVETLAFQDTNGSHRGRERDVRCVYDDPGGGGRGCERRHGADPGRDVPRAGHDRWQGPGADR